MKETCEIIWIFFSGIEMQFRILKILVYLTFCFTYEKERKKRNKAFTQKLSGIGGQPFFNIVIHKQP